jgi:hypothetical protein
VLGLSTLGYKRASQRKTCETLRRRVTLDDFGV